MQATFGDSILLRKVQRPNSSLFFRKPTITNNILLHAGNKIQKIFPLVFSKTGKAVLDIISDNTNAAHKNENVIKFKRN